jgi:hypothetical protein
MLLFYLFCLAIEYYIAYVSYERNASISKDIYTYHILLITNTCDILKLLPNWIKQKL